MCTERQKAAGTDFITYFSEIGWVGTDLQQDKEAVNIMASGVTFQPILCHQQTRFQTSAYTV